ncbi:MBL fold metallo-hydrolase [Humidesulfovibrio sp.]
MRVRCWGARGSIPVSGPEFLRYGGDTSCLEVRSANNGLLILDAGTGIRALGCELARQGCLDATLLLSHYHWDHIQGLPFFKLLYNPQATLRLGGSRGARAELPRVLSRALRPPLFPVPFDKVPAHIEPLYFEGEALRVGSLLIRRIAASHPNKGAGFRIEENGASLVYLTDNELALRHRGGLGFADYVAFCNGANLLIHDAEYLPEEYPQRRGWGHSHIEDAARLAREAGVTTLGLFHHNQERSDADLDALLERCRGLLSLPGDPACVALFQGYGVEL